MRSFEISSDLLASAPEVWAHAVTPAGVNDEMFPLARMTFPHSMGSIVAGFSPGRRIFRSWILLACVLPLEYDDVAFAEVEEGRRFLERSVLLSQKVWEHERTVEPRLDGCRVTDRIAFEPRVRVLGGVYERVFRLFFAHRHRRLRARFGRA